MAAQVADRLDGIRGAVDLALVTFHGLLYPLAYLAETHVDPGLPDARVGGILDSSEEVVVHGIEGHGEGAVDDAAVDVDANVDLHDVALLEHRLVPGVRAEVCGDVVEVQSGGETHAGLDGVALCQAVVADQSAHAVLDAIRDLGQRLARLDVALCPLADLAMGLGSIAVVVEEVGVEIIQMALLLVRGSIAVLVDILDLLALGVDLAREEIGQQDARGFRLGGGGLLLLPRLSLLVLLLLGGLGGGVGRLLVGIAVGFVARVFCGVDVLRAAAGGFLTGVTGVTGSISMLDE